MPSSEKTTPSQSSVVQQKAKNTTLQPQESFFKKPGEGFFNRSGSTPFGAAEKPFFAPPVQLKSDGNTAVKEKAPEPKAETDMAVPEKTVTPPAPAPEKEEEIKKDTPPETDKTVAGNKDITAGGGEPVTATAPAIATPAPAPAATPAPAVKAVAAPADKAPEKDKKAEEPQAEGKQEKTTETGTGAAESGADGSSDAAPADNTGGASSTPSAPAGGDTPAAGKPVTAEGKPEGETGEAGDEPAKAETPAEPPAPATPGDDPEYQKLVGSVHTTAAKQSDHPKPAAAAAAIDKAASGGSNEVAARAQGNQVGKISQQKAKPFDREAFVAALMKKIEEITPKNLKEADEFKEKKKAANLKPALTRQVDAGKEKSQGDIKKTTQQQPSADGVKPKKTEALPPMKAGAKPALDGKGAVPKPRTDTEVNQPANEANQSLDDAYKKNDVTSEQLQASNEPEFISADNSKKESQEEIKKTPAAYRKDEQSGLQKAGIQIQGLVNTSLDGMHKSRAGNLGKAADHQHSGKDKNEAKRREINTELQRIYNNTKKDVEASLTKLDKDVNKLFDDGEAASRRIFEDYVDQEMEKYKDNRYSGAGGKVLWLHDLFFDLPPYVNRFYADGKAKYTNHMRGVLNQIGALVETTLNNATARVAQGKDEIKKYLDSLDPATKKIAQQETKNILSKFENLQQTIADKQTQLIDGLAQKYVDKMSELNKRIEELKEANKGWVTKAMAALEGVFKKIMELKDMLFGILKKAIKVIGAIIAHPIDFFSNLAKAVGDGIGNFVKNIGDHLKRGFLSWLMGNMPPGVELPQSLDLKEIFKFTMQVLGFSWANIRAKAVARLGEKTVRALETVSDKAFDIFKILAKGGGLAEIWEYIKEQIGNLKEMVMDTIESYLTEQIINKGIQFILSLLNPASAFIKACEAIYNLVKFIIDRAQQILDFINSVLDSIDLISQGAVAPAAKKVEESLAKAIPVTLGFLASLLGLNGLANKVQEIIEKVRKPFSKAIDWLIEKAVAFAQKAFSKLMGKEEKKKEGGEEKGKENGHQHDPEKQQKINEGLADLREEEKKYLTNDKISHDEANKVAAAIKKRHPVFSSFKVKDDGKTWDYVYTASPETVVEGHEKEEGGRPKTVIVYNGVQGNRGSAVADPLTDNRTLGTKPTDIPGWRHAQILNKKHFVWKRGHMISQAFGGMGDVNNLSIITQTINSGMDNGPEQYAKDATAEGKILRYETTWKNHADKTSPLGDLISNFASEVKVVITDKADNTKKVYEFKPLDPPAETVDNVTINLNSVGRPTLMSHFGITNETFAKELLEARNIGGPFVNDIQKNTTRMEKYYEDKGYLENSDKFTILDQQLKNIFNAIKAKPALLKIDPNIINDENN